jgi:hypothetical protein
MANFCLKSKEIKIRPRSRNKVVQNAFKNTHEDNLNTFCDIISYITSKYRPDFSGTQKNRGTGPDFDEHYFSLSECLSDKFLIKYFEF